MQLYYPSNFPVHHERQLMDILNSLQIRWLAGEPITASTVRKYIRDDLRTHHASLFKGLTPPFWWFQFLLLRYQSQFNSEFIHTLHQTIIKTKIRSISGVVPLTLFTAGTGCPFHCVYCPTETGVPKSYLSDEPAVMRAIRSKYSPFVQTQSRLIMFALSGHSIEKVEIIVKGGTFSFLPRRYRTFFIRSIFNAANTSTSQLLSAGKTIKSSLTLEKAQERNESAQSRIIGINIETRPDYINPYELRYLRSLGVTHVELGMQTIYDDILTKIKRGHSITAVYEATRQLRDAGFKIGYHLMPNLPGSTPERDYTMMKEIFTNENFLPDHLKLYPTTITKYTTLEKWFQEGTYTPYPLNELINIIVRIKKEHIPPWVRIGRLTRDITTNMMTGNTFPPNLREVIQLRMREQNSVCSCIRCREIQLEVPKKPITIREIAYNAGGGKEYFIEHIDAQKKCLGFIRLRFPSYLFKSKTKPLFKALHGCALIRELHVYGKATGIGKKDSNSRQHKGLGEQLLEYAEEKVRKAGFRKLAIISGVGVRNYYRKIGYSLRDTYMLKNL